MPKFFVKNDQVHGDEIAIVGQDVNHILNVLRLTKEDKVNICNTDSRENYIAKIIEIGADIMSVPEVVKCEIIEKIDSNHESNIHITAFQGLPKADKMELIIEKCVELGVGEIIPVEMKRCVVKLDDKNKDRKIERWQKIAETAAKQSGRDIIPEIGKIINTKNICNLICNYDIVLLAYEEERENKLKDELNKLIAKERAHLTRRLSAELTEGSPLHIGIIVGPEGGLEENEVEQLKEKGAKVVSLGKRILRTETVRTYDGINYNV